MDKDLLNKLDDLFKDFARELENEFEEADVTADFQEKSSSSKEKRVFTVTASIKDTKVLTVNMSVSPDAKKKKSKKSAPSDSNAAES